MKTTKKTHHAPERAPIATRRVASTLKPPIPRRDRHPIILTCTRPRDGVATPKSSPPRRAGLNISIINVFTACAREMSLRTKNLRALK
jgi:hypothetical protein